ncbi:MAG TPA: phosphatidylglycerol lysyltransferase domain-containing protein [Vicinamibacteria bacterium]|nr:phosphatidylglycerol lysyltransferase domain-containing protein [Vicinamibacteria bacterium]
MEALLVKYGYALLFLGVAFEGEAVLLAAALLAQRGLFRLPVVIAVAVAANSLADQVYFQLARQRGRAWLERRFGQHPRYRRLMGFLARRGPLLLVVSRFAYGLRVAIPAACGALGMGVLAFTAIDLLAGLLWAIPMGLLGYLAGGALGSLLEGVRRYEEGIALVLVVGAAVWLGVRRGRRVMRWREQSLADLLALFHRMVPFVVGLMGVLNLLSAIWPREPHVMHQLHEWLPLEVTQGSRVLMLLSGVALLQVTRNLGRRKALAWWVAVGALSASLLSHVGRAFDVHHSMVAAVLLGYFLVYRRRFHALSDPASLRQALVMAPALAAVVWVFGVVGLADLHRQFLWAPGTTPALEAFRTGLLILDPAVQAQTRHAAQFLASLQILGWAARLYLLVLLLRPVMLRRRQEAPAEAVSRLVAEHGRRSLAAFAAQEDKHHLLVAQGRALVAFAVRGGVAFSAGDPLCAPDDLLPAASEFVAYCRRHGWTPCFYEAAEEPLCGYQRLGMRSLKMAEEAIVDLPSFSLAGGKRAALRSMVHKVTRMGLAVRRHDRLTCPDAAIDEQLEEISEAWLAEKRLGEMGFSVSRFSLEALAGVHLFLCLEGERLVAFTSWRPYRGGRAAVLDLMRKRRDAPSGTMDLLVSRSLEGLRDAGLCEASLANAPLANVGEPRGGLERGVALLFENLNAFYGYKNLFQFKKKFAPRWEGRYLVYPGSRALPEVAYAITQVHGAGGLRQLLRRR